MKRFGFFTIVLLLIFMSNFVFAQKRGKVVSIDDRDKDIESATWSGWIYRIKKQSLQKFPVDCPCKSGQTTMVRKTEKAILVRVEDQKFDTNNPKDLVPGRVTEFKRKFFKKNKMIRAKKITFLREVEPLSCN